MLEDLIGQQSDTNGEENRAGEGHDPERAEVWPGGAGRETSLQV